MGLLLLILARVLRPKKVDGAHRSTAVLPRTQSRLVAIRVIRSVHAACGGKRRAPRRMPAAREALDVAPRGERVRTPIVRIGCTAVLGLLHVSPSASAQDVHPSYPEAGVRAVSTSLLPPRELRGVVIDAMTGDLLPGAPVYLDGLGVGVLSDSLGRFRFSSPQEGKVRLSADYIGRESVSQTLDLPSDRGTAVQIGLLNSGPAFCQRIVVYKEDRVDVKVRDVLSGEAPQTELRLTVFRDGRESSSSSDTHAAADHALLGVETGKGPFTVEVSAPGYSVWRIEGIEKENDRCSGVIARPLQVWLLPQAGAMSNSGPAAHSLSPRGPRLFRQRLLNRFLDSFG